MHFECSVEVRQTLQLNCPLKIVRYFSYGTLCFGYWFRNNLCILTISRSWSWGKYNIYNMKGHSIQWFFGKSVCPIIVLPTTISWLPPLFHVILNDLHFPFTYTMQWTVSFEANGNVSWYIISYNTHTIGKREIM